MSNADLMEENEVSKNSNGGTELIKRRLYNGEVSRDLLEKFQIVFSRQRELNKDKYRIFYAHDLPGDPEASNALDNEGWKNYHKIVFVSNWQMQEYINFYRIPWSKCVVLQNSIIPIELREKTKEKVKLIYHSTPHRGLDILATVFDNLCKKYENLELDVYSSFNLYGWKDRDNQFAQLFEFLDNHPKINNHGSVSNDEVRNALAESHIFAYPSIWPETSCISLMEAMSAGLLCVHPNYAALYETAANWTVMYNWHEDKYKHAESFYHHLEGAINIIQNEKQHTQIMSQKSYTDLFYNWNMRKYEWINFLNSIVGEPLEIEYKQMFVYNS